MCSFLTSKNTCFPEAPQQTSCCVFLVSIVPHSLAGCWEFGSSLAGQLCLVSHEARCEGWMGWGICFQEGPLLWLLVGGLSSVGFSSGCLSAFMAWQLAFPPHRPSKRPSRAFVTQPQRPHTIFPSILFRSHRWALTPCGRGLSTGRDGHWAVLEVGCCTATCCLHGSCLLIGSHVCCTASL